MSASTYADMRQRQRDRRSWSEWFLVEVIGVNLRRRRPRQALLWEEALP